MAIFEHLPDTLRNLFDEGLDEVLIFAVIFIFILISGKDPDSSDSPGALPLLVIALFLLVFAGISRSEDTTRQPPSMNPNGTDSLSEN